MIYIVQQILNTHLIRQEAARLGFAFTGIAKAERLDKEAKHLEQWLNKGYQGEMAYMANHFEKRVDPTLLVPGAKSVIALMHNYFPDKKQHDLTAPKIARYAYGKDYHFVIKKKLKDLLAFIQGEIGEVNGRCFVDSAPVMEREWAKRAGLGWAGKNTLLIHPKAGSYFFLAELIVDLELLADNQVRDYCGTCSRCIEACPTEAILPEGYILDASKCISYLTIELKTEMPLEFKTIMENWVFGCDICQEVCPWNRFSEKHNEAEFYPKDEMLEMSKRKWEEITDEVFNRLFKESALQRTKYSGLKRNLEFLKSNTV